MTRSIALLRGINVGGNRKVPMADLRALLADAGYHDVVTYIQSGNVVFGHGTVAEATLVADLERLIADAMGFDVAVMLRTAAQMAAVARKNPYPSAAPTERHVAFFPNRLPKDAFADVDLDAFIPEELTVSGREVYLHLPHGMGRAQIPVALKKVLAPATVRNWRTVTTLVELSA